MVSVGVLCVQHGRKETDPSPLCPLPSGSGTTHRHQLWIL